MPCVSRYIDHVTATLQHQQLDQNWSTLLFLNARIDHEPCSVTDSSWNLQVKYKLLLKKAPDLHKLVRPCIGVVGNYLDPSEDTCKVQSQKKESRIRSMGRIGRSETRRILDPNRQSTQRRAANAFTNVNLQRSTVYTCLANRFFCVDRNDLQVQRVSGRCTTGRWDLSAEENNFIDWNVARSLVCV